MRIHCILHETFEGPACINTWIKLKGYSVSYTRTFLSEPYPAVNDFDWLIIMGGGMSVNEESAFNWLKPEKEFIREAVNSDKIILGICFGAQLLAEALGAMVYSAQEQEIGWFPVKLFKENWSAILKEIPESMTVFHWHGDTFSLPDSVLLLASSELTKNQAFLYNDKILALQFHFEIDRSAVESMLGNAGKSLRKSKYVQTANEIGANLKYIRDNNRIMFKILDYLNSRLLLS